MSKMYTSNMHETLSDHEDTIYMGKLRDEFAKAAMQVLLHNKNDEALYSDVAEAAYRQADAMLKARLK